MRTTIEIAIARIGDPKLREAFRRLPEDDQRRLAPIYREMGDRKGSGGEITTPPQKGGSRKHPYRR